MTILLIFTAVCCLAFANGANDNFKGVATLWGSGTTNYNWALAWATVTTFLGSVAAIWLADQLLDNFNGKGLVSNELAGNAEYSVAVAFGAGLTILIATRVGMPISTTHSLIGALIGAGCAAGSTIELSRLSSGFFAPLLFSPLLAIAVTSFLYPIFKFVRRYWGITSRTCLCIGSERGEMVPSVEIVSSFQQATRLSVTIGHLATCKYRFLGTILSVDANAILHQLHFLSAGMVSFARGLNDTPKMAALLLLVPSLGSYNSIALVGIVIAIGGLVSTQRVAVTMSENITAMNHSQGFTANLVTSLIVIWASRFGAPVSTTHVSCGSLFGLGAVTRQAHWKMIATILTAWLVTLPMAAITGGICYLIIQYF